MGVSNTKIEMRALSPQMYTLTAKRGLKAHNGATPRLLPTNLFQAAK